MTTPPTALPPLSSTENDLAYSTELARRSVARAALHLGIDTISPAALDCVGDVLITFLQTVGTGMNALAESSNRSSAHVNVLDAIRSVEGCAAPAAGHSRFEAGGSAANGFPWEDLARFAFGADWEKGEEGFSVVKEAGEGVSPPRVPNGEANGSSGVALDDGVWNAPYLDLVPAYPISRANKTRTENGTNGIWKQQGHVALEEEACREDIKDGDHEELAKRAEEKVTHDVNNLSDDQYWGAPLPHKPTDDTGTSSSLSEPNKISSPPEDPITAERPAKKVKFDHDASDSAEASFSLQRQLPNNGEEIRPAYVPPFLPPFPPTHTYSSKSDPPPQPITEKPPSTNVVEESQSIRTSLVQLAEEEETEMKETPENGNEDASSMVVPSGRSTDAMGGEVDAPIAPLNKASGSRVSRILEGSMDASQL